MCHRYRAFCSVVFRLGQRLGSPSWQPLPSPKFSKADQTPLVYYSCVAFTLFFCVWWNTWLQATRREDIYLVYPFCIKNPHLMSRLSGVKHRSKHLTCINWCCVHCSISLDRCGSWGSEKWSSRWTTELHHVQESFSRALCSVITTLNLHL